MMEPLYLTGPIEGVRERISRMNALIHVIGDTGRGFLRSRDGNYSCFGIAELGGGKPCVLYWDNHTQKPLIPAEPFEFKGARTSRYPYLTPEFRELAAISKGRFSNGGTLWRLVQDMHSHIITGASFPFRGSEECGRGPAYEGWGYSSGQCRMVNDMAEHFGLVTPSSRMPQFLDILHGTAEQDVEYELSVGGMKGKYLLILETCGHSVVLADDNQTLDGANRKLDDYREILKLRAENRRKAVVESVQPPAV